MTFRSPTNLISYHSQPLGLYLETSFHLCWFLPCAVRSKGFLDSLHLFLLSLYLKCSRQVFPIPYFPISLSPPMHLSKLIPLYLHFQEAFCDPSQVGGIVVSLFHFTSFCHWTFYTALWIYFSISVFAWLWAPEGKVWAVNSVHNTYLVST